MRVDFDIAIVGSGFAGSLMAMIARRLGRSVILLEGSRHPRFAIGESSTPLANLLLEELARRYELDSVLPLCKWGTWQRTHPKLACGLKRGFTFYHHQFGKPWNPIPDRANELLVAASPHDAIADTHWYRADVDQFLMEEARLAGAEYVDEIKLDRVEFAGDSCLIAGERKGRSHEIRARIIIDASGPRGFLHRALGLGSQRFPAMPITNTIFSHFENVQRWDSIHRSSEAPPYPGDDAAVHHLFPGGWIWVLRFNNGVTSAGVAATRELSAKYRFEEGASAWERLLRDLPSVAEIFAPSRAIMPFGYSPELAWRSLHAAGANWALLPSAAGFVDPLLSTGFPLTLLGVQRLANIVERHWTSEALQSELAQYELRTFDELELSAALVRQLYRAMDRFPDFINYSMLYFAAASFSETARRLNKHELATSFLAADHPVFGPILRKFVAKTLSTFSDDSARDAITPINVAGLCNPQHRNWYSVRASDLLTNCTKLSVDTAAVERMLAGSGFWDHQKPA
jgi:tetracycline 7-halogenase / FADH2 O2-dependent halogenase